MKTAPTLLAVTLLLGLGACSKKPQPAPAPAPSLPTTTADDGATRREAEERARREAEEARLRAETARAQETLARLIYFDFDSFEIRADSRQQLDGKIPLLRTSPDVRLRIAGHTDERGSVEYNLALGMRRAQSAKDYLVGFGLSPDRFETISFGEERPQETGQDEEAFARNRRAEFQVNAGTVVVR